MSTTAFADERPYSGSCLWGFWTGHLTQQYDDYVGDNNYYATVNGEGYYYKSYVCVGEDTSNKLTGINNNMDGYDWVNSVDAPLSYSRYIYMRIDNTFYYGTRLYISGAFGLFGSLEEADAAGYRDGPVS